MILKFPYVAEKIPRSKGKHKVFRPKIPITLLTPNGEIDIVAMIDSGADFSIMSRELAEALGLDLSGNLEEGDGFGGVVKMRAAKVSIRLGDVLIPKMYINVLENDESFKDFCLGRHPFFDNFKITFDNKKKMTVLEHRR